MREIPQHGLFAERDPESAHRRKRTPAGRTAGEKKRRAFQTGGSDNENEKPGREIPEGTEGF